MQIPVVHAHVIISGDVTIPIDPPQIINGWCFYTTYVIQYRLVIVTYHGLLFVSIIFRIYPAM